MEPSVIRKACAVVGLRPWNPPLIRKNCRKHFPPVLDSPNNNVVDVFARKVSEYSAKQKAEIEPLRSTVKRAIDKMEKKSRRRSRADDVTASRQPGPSTEGLSTSTEEGMGVGRERPVKQTKLMQMESKTCTAIGYQKIIFGQ